MPYSKTYPGIIKQDLLFQLLLELEEEVGRHCYRKFSGR
jgi:hypothetical protein